MSLLLVALAILCVSGVLAFAAGRQSLASRCGVAGAVAGCALGLVPAIRTLATGEAVSIHAAWQVPYGAFALSIDPLAAWFLLAIFGLALVTSIYGGTYLQAYRERKRLGPVHWWWNCLIASMVVVVTAQNAVLFLVGWEVMSLASFFLVTFEDERQEVRRAGWIYLVATHLGTAALLLLFAWCGQLTGSMDFDHFQALSRVNPALAGTLFVLAVIGFGTKAGFFPLHIWLPEAHPAAPSHVSALMSGVMIKMGIYGLLRMLTFFGSPPAWWGWLMIGIGLTSGILGVLFALAQRDLKRVLAYSSIENIGIIALGIGIGLLGKAMGQPVMSLLGFSGALLHVLNHALFKGLLFLGAGSVLHATGTRQLADLGGLLKSMPWTGVTFLVGAAAICGLPPFNGFVSEWLVYMGSFQGILGLFSWSGTGPFLVIVGLALIGGLALACFTRAFGLAFLGVPRTAHAQSVHEAKPAMTIPLAVLAFGCLAIGVWPAGILRLATPVVVQLAGSDSVAAYQVLQDTTLTLTLISSSVLILVCGFALLVMFRRALLVGKPVTQSVTWSCGYAAPTARMQYTASSFSLPLAQLFRVFLRTRLKERQPAGYFPHSAALESYTPDVAYVKLARPLGRMVKHALARLRWIQQGRVQLYLLYMFVTLLVLLMWKLGV